MGTFATFAIVVSLIYFTASRSTLKLVRDAAGPDQAKTSTNFHETKSTARPEGGVYYSPSYKIF